MASDGPRGDSVWIKKSPFCPLESWYLIGWAHCNSFYLLQTLWSAYQSCVPSWLCHLTRSFKEGEDDSIHAINFDLWSHSKQPQVLPQGLGEKNLLLVFYLLGMLWDTTVFAILCSPLDFDCGWRNVSAITLCTCALYYWNFPLDSTQFLSLLSSVGSSCL